MVSLLARFYTPCSGAILLDGINIRFFDPSWLRTRIGIVDQVINIPL